VSGGRPPERSGRPALFVMWVDHNTRSESLARALGADLLRTPWSHPRQPKAAKLAAWLRSGLATWRRVRALPPGGLLVVMAPPVFAPLVSLLARRRDVALAIDMHSGALDDPKWRWSFPLMRRLLRRADAVIATTPEVLQGLAFGGTETVFIVDPTLAAPPAGDTMASESVRADPPRPRPYVLFPASGEADEPIDAVAEAAARLAGEIDVVVTGRQPARLAGTALQLTGFVSAAEYRRLMAGATVVLALTTREATNQRAACEALQYGRPLLCSATRMLRETYGGAALFTAPTGDAIAAGIREGLARQDELRAGIPAVVARLREQARAGVLRLHDLSAR
jgi:glycosyltransferase involved in cell wall biosynthesis